MPRRTPPTFATSCCLPLLAALLALGVGCSDSPSKANPDAGSVGGGDAGADTSLADGYLRSSNLVSAHAAYEAAAAIDPKDSHAAFGAALTTVLLLPDDPAVDAVLDLCGQPHLDFADKLFGPTGMLALDRDARQGSGALAMGSRMGPSGDWADVAFQADSWRTTSEALSTPGLVDQVLRLQVRDISFAGHQNAQLDLEVPYSNAAAYGLPVQRLADGLVVPAEQFGGTLRVSLPSADGMVWDTYDRPVSGNLVFKKVGTGATGDAVTVELVNLELEGRPRSCNDVCGPNDWPYLKIDGSVSDTISGKNELALPFASLAEDDGPPHRDPLIVMIDGCPGLTAEYLRQELAALLEVLEQAAGHLAVVLADPDAEVFQFKVPGGLLFADGEIPLNITDARVFRAVLDTTIALGRGLTQYRTFAKRFDELIGEYQLWLDTRLDPSSRAERGFLVRKLVEELNSVFMGREPGFDLSRARQWANASLVDASLALTREPKNAGVFNFQTPNAKSFAADFQAQIEFLQTSLLKPGLQGFPHAPDYRISLAACFETPLDIDSLHQASTSGSGVFVLVPGDPAGQWAYDRNDRMELDQDGVTRALDPVFQLPVDLSEKPCDLTTTACPGKYTCVLDYDGLAGHCQQPEFQLLDKDALKRAVPDSGDPAFVDTEALRPLEALF